VTRSRRLAGMPGEVSDDLPDRDKDMPTLSMCFFVGYFFSELLRLDCPETSYQLAKDKRFADYNSTVLASTLPRSWVEPVNIVRNICLRGMENKGRLEREDVHEVYDIWRRGLSGQSAEPT
jgi:hypothetical protein